MQTIAIQQKEPVNMSSSKSAAPSGAGGAAPAAATPALQKLPDRSFQIKAGQPHFNAEHNGKQPVYAHSTNEVITSKYTFVTFLPLNLFEQFLNLANLYFLLVGIFQIVPQFTTTGGNPTMYQPLAFIVFVSACRAAKEDWDKHKADHKRNSYGYGVYKNGKLETRESGQIRVGDIIQVKQNDMIPADLLFLSSSLSKGHCFIDKSNLNGETTLEVMNSIQATKNICSSPDGLHNLNFSITYEAPNKRFDSFRGILTAGAGMTVPPTPHSLNHPGEMPLDGKVLLMRETNLRNCDWIFGLVVYTGNDTKIQKSNMDGEKPKMKVSYIMRCVNTYLKYMLLLQTTLCFIGGVLAGVFRGGFTSDMWFLKPDNAPAPALVGLYAFFSWFILLSQMVPISLIVSSELVKFIQSVFIEKDIQLYFSPINKPAKCNSSTIHEDLGLIDYIFSDKTGTLTQNKMQFRYLYTPAGEYGSKETDIAKSVKIRQQELEDKLAGKPPSTKSISWTKLVKPYLAEKNDADKKQNCCQTNCPSLLDAIWNAPPPDPHLAEDDEALPPPNQFTEEERQTLLKALWGPSTSPQQKAIIRRYMTHMALSNTVKPYDDEGVLKMQAESAEELAMVNFARSCGFLKKQINPTVLEITEYDNNLANPRVVIETYNHVATFGFTSKRARVTVVYQRTDGGPQEKNTVHVMLKGQDTVALPLMSLGDVDEDELLANLKNMSTNGLRTLVCGYSDLPGDWWQSRAAEYQQVISLDITPAAEGHPEKCQKGVCEKCRQHDLFEKIEKDANLLYLGCLGMEDQLAVLVPETIRDCLSAGIKVWMITGDKLETAKNIGLACNLIDPDMIPNFSSAATIDECVEEFRRTRLIEITGSWANMVDSESEIIKIFQVFDKDKDGQLNINELSFILTSLRFNLPQDRLHKLIQDSQHEDEIHQNAPTKIGPKAFVRLMQSARLSKFDAVKFDIEEGIKTFNQIQNHEAYPVSLLMDRSAFQVLFPGKAGARVSQADLLTLSPDGSVTEKDLDKLKEMFFQLAGRAKSVVFSRAEPSMKKRVVSEIQARVKEAITLAIGDGANDVDMITTAHIGVGIAGVEGTAATNSSDYSVGTFRMLHCLLFVHGFWSYQRTSKLVNFIFYKASLVAVVMFLFGFFSAMSGQQFLADSPYQLYNVMYTALPIMFVAVFDKVLPKETLQDNPILYRKAKHTAFDPLIFSGWIFRSFLHAAIVFFIPYAAFGIQNVNQSSGRAEGIWYWSVTVYYCTVMTPTLLIIYEMTSISFLHWMSIFLSILALFLVTWIMNILTFVTTLLDLTGVVNEMYATPIFWLLLMLTVGISMVIELFWRGYMRESYPTVVQIYQEINRFGVHERLKAQDPANHGPNRESKSFMNRPIILDPTKANQPGYNNDGQRSRENSVSHSTTGSGSKEYRHLKNNLVRAMLRFRNMTGAQFDSAAQAQLQQHDPYTTDGSAAKPSNFEREPQKQPSDRNSLSNPQPASAPVQSPVSSSALHSISSSSTVQPSAIAVLSRYENQQAPAGRPSISSPRHQTLAEEAKQHDTIRIKDTK